MAVCPRVASCPLFTQFKMSSSMRVWQAFYCEGDFGRCERWQRASAGQAVPERLLPNGRRLDVPVEQLEPHHLS